MNLRVFNRFPVITTPRLVLRELAPADGEAVFALRCDEEVNRYQSLDAPATLQQARALIARWRKRFSFKAEIRWAVATRDDGVFAGTCAYAHFVPWVDRGHITYELARRAWGRGLATEAVRAMVAFGHGEAGLDRIEAVVVPEHQASVNVLLKAGFAEEGLLRAYGSWKGQHHDLRMFSIVRPRP
jgi:[ribosomal protein S5]-alanine N-acetyltransferase